MIEKLFKMLFQKKLNYKFLLIIILLIAAILRFYKLDTLPPSMEWDEVATGYDAYSILKTGRDQYGHFLPLTFRSLDDYKPPLYTYLTSASIAILGWNDFAVRFPAALLGTLAVLTTYLMVYEIFKNRKLAILSSFFLAVSPWHVNFSRLALETNSTIFFTTFGVWLFLKGLKNGRYLILSALTFGLDLYLYHNTRIFVPLFGLVMLIMYRQSLGKQKKWLVISGLIISIFIIRLIPILFSIEGQMRFLGTSIFSPAKELHILLREQATQVRLTSDEMNGIGLLGKIFHSQKTFDAERIAENYLSHFNPDFWFFTDDNPRHHMPQMGLLYFVDLPLLILGIYYLIRSGNKTALVLIFAWMLITPIPASVTRDAPHALRTEIFLPTFQIIAAFGFIGLIGTIKRKREKLSGFLVMIIASLYAFNVLFFLDLYLLHYAVDTSEYWQYGRKEAVEYSESVKYKYDRILVSTEMLQPQAFFLYYLKYDPAKYLKEGGTYSGGWAEDRNRIDKYFFKPLNYSEMKDGKTLFIGMPNEFPDGTDILKKIKYLNGKDAIWIAD